MTYRVVIVRSDGTWFVRDVLGGGIDYTGSSTTPETPAPTVAPDTEPIDPAQP